MERLITRLAHGVVDRPWVALGALTAITAFAAIGHVDPKFFERDDDDADRPAAAAAETGQVRQAPDVKPVQVSRGDVILVAESDAFFTADGARAMRAVVAALEDLDAVRSVLWMDAAPMLNIFGLPEPVLPRGHASPARFAAARQRALAHPLVGGQLLSADGRTLLLLIDMEWLYVTSDADCTVQLRKTAEQAAAAFPSVPIAFQLTGNVPIRISNAANTRGNERKYQLIGYGLSLAIAWVLFRGPEAVLIVALAPAFGVFWTMGLLPLFGLGGNPFNAVVVPVLLCMVGFTDGVHMMAQIRRHRALGLEPAEATRAAIREVGLACWLTSLTTAIGFGSLAWAHHEVVREFGYSCVIGVLATFFSVVTIVPLACASPLGRRVHRGYGANLIDQNLQRISVVVDCILRHSRAVAWGSLAGTAVLAAVTLQLRPDERLTSSLPAGSEAGSALARIDRQFGGMETARVEIGWSADVPDGAAEIGAVAAAAAEAVRSEPLLGSPLSIVELLDALPGEGPAGSRMSLLELLPPPLKRAYYVPEQRRANVTFRLQDIGIAHYGPVFERLEKRLAAIQRQHPRFALQLDGSAIWRWKDLYRIVLDLIASLGSASLIIFGVMAVSYRSLRIGLIAVPANLFPLVATGAMLYGAGQSLEIVSVCSFTICLGIAVDDTIHFLTRFQEEQARCGERLSAIRNAFVGVGAAMIMTTVVLAMGFGSALLSDARDHRLFATMGILTILTALVADLLFLPALLAQFAPPPPRTAENVLAD